MIEVYADVCPTTSEGRCLKGVENVRRNLVSRPAAASPPIGKDIPI